MTVKRKSTPSNDPKDRKRRQQAVHANLKKVGAQSRAIERALGSGGSMLTSMVKRGGVSREVTPTDTKITVTVKSVKAHQVLRLKRPITVERVERGLSAAVVATLRRQLELSMKETIGLLGIPRQTLNRRKEAGHLSADESDRVVRYAELLARATDLIGEKEEAAKWLSEPAPALGNETPLNYAKTELGAREVFDLIERLEHGIAT